ncbi:aldehyde dehydrogenase (NADP(+)) [Rhizobiaceae bacterium BDR2-2]|uniref:Aldehyde dehydrogenase (NADP(+)) n=1 Tax=Ectorhizobium quercum TaxID=2965071 RepID=A0AAE3N179_9HYPH|nr:aldehyde dehydrogenase (NADP(+)) [Ectorhizobium quercum]MCX8998271.1 aldehyde dehydrogenase (NADP(+)) [Ectorhizobium quercum]
MAYTPHGRHLIAGEWVAGEATFLSSPSSGPAQAFSAGTEAHVDAAAKAAEDAFWTYGYLPRETRAGFLMAIAAEIEERGAAITDIAVRETGLPAARIDGERARTTGQLRLFVYHILKGEFLDRRFDAALPDRQPLPRPEIRLMQRPVGPVGVFGASNFPLAFSVAGGDTASALAAGCPVVVKGHPAHPGTGEIVAEAIRAAIATTGVPKGVFSFVHGQDRLVGEALVRHPLIKAVGFTGSLAGGRALFDLCARRPEPIPFFGELGSVNPMFVLPEALFARGPAIAAGWAASLTMGAGQFCTNPGIVVVPDGKAADRFVSAARTALEKIGPQTMLTDGIAEAFRRGHARFAVHEAVRPVIETQSEGRTASPSVYETTADAFLRDHALSEEVFGPLGLVVRVPDGAAMIDLARAFEGQLTATLHMDRADAPLARQLLPVLERKAGRILANGFPTGVEVSDAMIHGGPYPASTNFGATSVGTMAIRRFLRPVSYQNLPDEILPTDIRP